MTASKCQDDADTMLFFFFQFNFLFWRTQSKLAGGAFPDHAQCWVASFRKPVYMKEAKDGMKNERSNVYILV